MAVCTFLYILKEFSHSLSQNTGGQGEISLSVIWSYNLFMSVFYLLLYDKCNANAVFLIS